MKVDMSQVAPSIWLSVMDICNMQVEQHESLREVLNVANERFDQSFNIDVLLSDYVPEKKA